MSVFCDCSTVLTICFSSATSFFVGSTGLALFSKASLIKRTMVAGFLAVINSFLNHSFNNELAILAK
ncbi:MAG: hypothetical protein HUJ68_11130 [Clostridia bacterium]|nr:hypothetical protein [Clostridia bacterium]